MADDDDPYAKYLKPSGSQAAPTPTAPAAAAPDPGADPYSKYLANPPAASAAAKPATYDDTTNLGLAGDTAYRAANTGTLGALDYGLAGLHAIERGTGYDPNATDLTQIQKENQEWGQAHPYLGLAADVAGYGLGAGKLGLGGKLATKLGGSVLARMAGAGAENVGSTLISDELGSQGQASAGDLLKSAILSGTVGGITGAIPGGKGKLADLPSPTTDLKNATEQAFKPLEQTHYNPTDVANDFNSVQGNLAAKQIGSNSLNDQIDKISQSIAAKQKAGKSVTADDLTNFQIDINKASQGGRDIGIAKAYNDALDNTMATTKPLFTPLSGPAEIAAQSDAARAAALKSNISGDIDDWMSGAARKPDAVRDDIAKSVNANPGFYPGTVGEQLKAASQKPGLGGKLLTVGAQDLGGAALTGGASYLLGGDPWLDALAGAGGAMGGHALGHALSQPGTNALVQKLAAARHMNANPGAQVNPADFRKGIAIPGPMRAYGPNLGAGTGVGASNLFYGTSP